MSKEEIRRKILALREAQKPVLKNKNDAAVLKNLLTCAPFIDAHEFFTYLSHKGEVSTDEIIKTFFGKKKIIVPKISEDELCLYELKNSEEFLPGRFGIREPQHCLPHRKFSSIDVALIPGIAFDATGHRIGFGGGYFDRLLKKVHCTTIGVAYEFQIIDKVLTGPYDVAVDFIVTEKRIIRPQP